MVCSRWVHCPKCQTQIFCECASIGGNMFKAPGCQSCKSNYEQRIHDAKTEIAALQLMTTKQQFAQKKLDEGLVFLKLPDTGSSTEIFKGDVAFVFQGYDAIHKILAHSFVLAGKSSVFSRMFDCGMLEDKTRVVTMDDASYHVMQAVINYCYTADISFTDKVPPAEVLKVAHKYEITHLRDVCAEELWERIDEKNIVEMLRLSMSYEAKTLEEASAKFFKENLDTVFPTVMESL